MFTASHLCADQQLSLPIRGFALNDDCDISRRMPGGIAVRIETLALPAVDTMTACAIALIANNGLQATHEFSQCFSRKNQRTLSEARHIKHLVNTVSDFPSNVGDVTIFICVSWTNATRANLLRCSFCQRGCNLNPRRHVWRMHLSGPATPPDTPTQRAQDRTRLLRALNASLGSILLLCAIFATQFFFRFDALTIRPHVPEGLIGILTAPLLHGSLAHLGANAVAILLLGTLAGSVYPHATLRALPVLWLTAGLGPWLWGEAGSHHLGASGITHGLMYLVFFLGLLRRDRPAIAAAMIAFLLYGGMLLTVLPREPDVSWQAHLGGAVGGIVSAWLFRRSDPLPPRKRYSWEEEEDAEVVALDDPLEPPRPADVPVLWQRGEPQHPAQRTVLPFVRRRIQPPGTDFL